MTLWTGYWALDPEVWGQAQAIIPTTIEYEFEFSNLVRVFVSSRVILISFPEYLFLLVSDETSQVSENEIGLKVEGRTRTRIWN